MGPHFGVMPPPRSILAVHRVRRAVGRLEGVCARRRAPDRAPDAHV